MTDYDYSDFKKPEIQIGGNLIGALVDLANQQEAAELEVERLSNLLDEANTNLKRISEVEIPKLMDGVDGDFKLPDGRKVSIKEKIRANISEDNKGPAMKWLDENNHGGLVKRKFTIEFGRDQEEWAKEFEKQLEESKQPLNVKKERNVQWQTLDAFVREQLSEGSEFPQNLFGVFRQRSTKIKAADKK